MPSAKGDARGHADGVEGGEDGLRVVDIDDVQAAAVTSHEGGVAIGGEGDANGKVGGVEGGGEGRLGGVADVMIRKPLSPSATKAVLPSAEGDAIGNAGCVEGSGQ